MPSKDYELVVDLSAVFFTINDLARAMKSSRGLHASLPMAVLALYCSGRRVHAFPCYGTEVAYKDLVDVELACRQFRNVECVDLSRCQQRLSANALKALGGLPRLTYLCLGGTGVDSLAGLERSGARVLSAKSATLRSLAGCPPHLRELDASFTLIRRLDEPTGGGHGPHSGPAAGPPLRPPPPPPLGPSLVVLRVDSTPVASLEPLRRCPGLAELWAAGTRVGNLAGLEACGRLRILSLGGTRVSDLSPLAAGCPRLERLLVARTRVSDLGPLAACPRLAVLVADLTRVAALAPLGGLDRLRRLSLSATDVRSVGALARCPALESLVLFDTRVASLAGLECCGRLRAVNLDYTLVTSLRVPFP